MDSERAAWAAYDGHRIDRDELKAVLVAAAVAEEREACALVASRLGCTCEAPWGHDAACPGLASANAIRARNPGEIVSKTTDSLPNGKGIG